MKLFKLVTLLIFVNNYFSINSQSINATKSEIVSDTTFVNLTDYNKDFVLDMKYATTEYNRRPNNIDANHTMAWVYYTKGNFSEAKKYMDKALRMGTKNAELLAHAGQIEMAAGNTKLASELIAKSKKINPNMPNTPLKKS